MKVLRPLLATLVTACGLILVAPAPPAAACTCRGGDAADYVGWADAVFVGTLTGPPLDEAEGPLIGSGDPLVYTFDVETVLAGSIGSVAQVQSARLGASCGLERMQVGKRYLMFAEAGRRRHVLSASLCGGSQPATDGLIRRVEAVTGTARPPTEMSVAADPRIGVRASTPTVGYVLLGFSGVVLVAVLWVLLPGRRRAGRST